ncbi:MAG: DUF177 domain-containing protein [Bacteroides sp.]|nr:DUF177 domain-containing protein [Bacteroides sp.]
MHNKVLIEDIERESDKILHYEFDEFMEEFGCNIKANLEFESLGEYIKVIGDAQGKIKLTCDRCLTEYEYDLDIDIEETYAKHSLQDEYGAELELSGGQFITDLNGEKEIDVYDLLYQSVILALPNKKVCGINCNEGMFVSDENMQIHDERMDVFKNIKIERQD